MLSYLFAQNICSIKTSKWVLMIIKLTVFYQPYITMSSQKKTEFLLSSKTVNIYLPLSTLLVYNGAKYLSNVFIVLVYTR